MCEASTDDCRWEMSTTFSRRKVEVDNKWWMIINDMYISLPDKCLNEWLMGREQSKNLVDSFHRIP